MARNAIESEIHKKLKLRINLKWPEMRSKVKFGHPNWPTSAILSKISKKKKLCIDLKWPEMRSKKNNYRCEMDRNEIESDFRTSKMVTGSHFVKKKKKKKKICIDLK